MVKSRLVQINFTLFWPPFFGAFQIFRPITYIVNLSIKQRTFPDNLKIAKVIPIFKQGSRSLCDNYRPISVLPVLSRVFEKCIYNQLISYFSSENIIPPTRFGFKTVHSGTAWLKPILSRSDNIFRRKIRYKLIIQKLYLILEELILVYNYHTMNGIPV